MSVLAQAAGWTVVLFIGGLGLIILWRISQNKISLDKLISEPNGDASLSRFQFLIFTFVVAMSLLVVVLGSDPLKLPEDIPAGLFALLGISGGSYVVSKGIQASRDTAKGSPPPNPPNQPAAPNPPNAQNP